MISYLIKKNIYYFKYIKNIKIKKEPFKLLMYNTLKV